MFQIYLFGINVCKCHEQNKGYLISRITTIYKTMKALYIFILLI